MSDELTSTYWDDDDDDEDLEDSYEGPAYLATIRITPRNAAGDPSDWRWPIVFELIDPADDCELELVRLRPEKSPIEGAEV